MGTIGHKGKNQQRISRAAPPRGGGGGALSPTTVSPMPCTVGMGTQPQGPHILPAHWSRGGAGGKTWGGGSDTWSNAMGGGWGWRWRGGHGGQFGGGLSEKRSVSLGSCPWRSRKLRGLGGWRDREEGGVEHLDRNRGQITSVGAVSAEVDAGGRPSCAETAMCMRH